MLFGQICHRTNDLEKPFLHAMINVAISLFTSNIVYNAQVTKLTIN
jgi:hypothetical protein